MTVEADLETLFRTRVRQLGGMVEKLAPTNAGMPDRLVLLPHGRIEFVELKTDTGRLRPDQRVWIERAGHLGTPVTVLHGRAEVEAWAVDRQRDLPWSDDARVAAVEFNDEYTYEFWIHDAEANEWWGSPAFTGPAFTGPELLDRYTRLGSPALRIARWTR
jgi:hypothetical protein